MVWQIGTEMVREQLAANGYDLPEKPLGNGRYGAAYAIKNRPGWVVKITGDFTEAASWTRVMEKGNPRKLPSLAAVECVVGVSLAPLGHEQFRNKTMFAIVQERLTHVSDPIMAFLTHCPDVLLCAAGMTNRCLDAVEAVSGWAGEEDNEDAIDEANNLSAKERPVWMANWYVQAGSDYASGEVPESAFVDLIRTVRSLKEDLAISVVDLHGENLMYRKKDRRIVITDLGLASVPKTTVPIVNPRR